MAQAMSRMNPGCGHQRQQHAWTKLVGLTLLQWDSVVGDLRAGVGAVKALCADSPGAVQFSIGLLPCGAVVQPDDSLEVGSSALAFAAGLQRRIDIGIERRVIALCGSTPITV